MLESLWIPKSDCLGENMRILLVVVLNLAIAPGDTMPTVPFPPSAPSQSGDQASKIPPDPLDSLVAPIALYPDPLPAQTWAASTYPLEISQLHQWRSKNPGLKVNAL